MGNEIDNAVMGNKVNQIPHTEHVIAQNFCRIFDYIIRNSLISKVEHGIIRIGLIVNIQK